MASKSLVDLVVFDLGGTICDGVDKATGLGNIGPINAIVRSLKKIWDVDVSYDIVLQWMATAKHEHLNRCLQWPSVKAQFVAKHGREPTRDDAMFCFENGFKPILEQEEMPGRSAPFEGVIDMFKALRAKDIKIGVDTGFYAKAVRIILANFGHNDLIDVDVGADEVVKARPAPYMIFKMMAELGLMDVRRIMKVGDVYPMDVLEGYNLGGISVGLYETGNTRPASAWKAFNVEGRQVVPVDWFTSSLADKEKLFKGWLRDAAERGTRVPYPMILIPHAKQLTEVINDLEKIEPLFTSLL